MAKTIAIVGFGPGTATAVAERFGEEGFSVALIGRSKERLDAGAAALNSKGIKAFAFPGDAADPTSIRAAVRAARSQLGPIGVLHWNAYSLDAGDLLTADDASLRRMFDVAVFGLLAAAEEALPDLRSDGHGAILVSNGGFGEATTEMDRVATQLHVMGLALSAAAKHKLAGLLAERLGGDGVFVGEVMVHGSIRGTGPESAGSIEPTAIARKHWELYQTRSASRVAVDPPVAAGK